MHDLFQVLPTMPTRRDWRIGCVGSGFVMRDCHLVAYRNAGFQPIAIHSRNHDSAKNIANQFQIATVHETIEALFHDNRIEVLDFAVPPASQPELIRQAIKAGAGRLRGILAQKPIALSTPVARDLAQRAVDAGIVLSVNQNMRFDHSIRAAKQLLDAKALGDVVLATIDMRAIPHWMPWAEELDSLSTFVMSIHHLDTFRYWLGTPHRVLASTRPDPRTKFPHVDGINLYILEYENGPRATSWDDVWAGPLREGAAGEPSIRWRIEGTLGYAEGTIGWPSYPKHEPSTLRYSTTHEPGMVHTPSWPYAWFPDAFSGTMAQLLVALETDQPPEISARDNLETIALCEAVFAAATEHRVTTVAEFLLRE